MKQLPDSKIYELELKYWPYKASWEKILEIVVKQTPKNGALLDMMCGPGYLLGKIAKKRKDLNLFGVDTDQRYISYSKKTYPGIKFEKDNVLIWQPKELFDVVACTGSLHHIPYEKQAEVIKKFASMVKPDGFVLISDPFIDDYKNETERKVAASKLGYEYLKDTILNGAPDIAVTPCIDLIYNDVFMDEYKDSLKNRLPKYKKVFKNVETIKTWPNFESEYGDYISICRK